MGFDKSQPKVDRTTQGKQFGEGFSFSFEVRQTWGPLSYATSRYNISSIALLPQGLPFSHENKQDKSVASAKIYMRNVVGEEDAGSQASEAQCRVTRTVSSPCLTGDRGAQPCEDRCPGGQ